MKITITLITIALFIILIFILKFTNKEPTCHNCGKRFRKKDLKDLRGSWHLKDCTCPQYSKYNSNNQL